MTTKYWPVAACSRMAAAGLEKKNEGEPEQSTGPLSVISVISVVLVKRSGPPRCNPARQACSILENLQQAAQTG